MKVETRRLRVLLVGFGEDHGGLLEAIDTSICDVDSTEELDDALERKDVEVLVTVEAALTDLHLARIPSAGSAVIVVTDTIEGSAERLLARGVDDIVRRGAYAGFGDRVRVAWLRHELKRVAGEDAVNHALAAFATRIIHDLRNPLAVISGNAQYVGELCRDGDADPAIVQAAADIEQSTDRLNEMLTRLQEFRAEHESKSDMARG
jgi:signal transduction histidine kinase